MNYVDNTPMADRIRKSAADYPEMYSFLRQQFPEVFVMSLRREAILPGQYFRAAGGNVVGDAIYQAVDTGDWGVQMPNGHVITMKDEQRRVHINALGRLGVFTLEQPVVWVSSGELEELRRASKF